MLVPEGTSEHTAAEGSSPQSKGNEGGEDEEETQGVE